MGDLTETDSRTEACRGPAEADGVGGGLLFNGWRVSDWEGCKDGDGCTIL